MYAVKDCDACGRAILSGPLVLKSNIDNCVPHVIDVHVQSVKRNYVIHDGVQLHSCATSPERFQNDINSFKHANEICDELYDRKSPMTNHPEDSETLINAEADLFIKK